MKKLFLYILTLNLLSAACFACTKPNYIPNNYDVISCGEFVGDYIEGYIVKDVNTAKLGAYTYWNDPYDYSVYPFDAQKRYNKQKVPADFDTIEVVRGGFIVAKNGKFGFYHVDKGEIVKPLYDKIYLSNGNKTLNLEQNNTTKTKNNPNDVVQKTEDAIFTVFIKPLFFWLDDALPSR